MIGIFGDSFAHEFNNKVAPGWPTHLSRLYNEKVENHSWYGTSLSYSYRKYLETDVLKYSKLIFICTEPGRQHLIDTNGKELLYNNQTWKTSYDLNYHPEMQEKFDINEDDSTNKQVLKAAELMNAWFPETWNFLEEVIKRDVTRTHSNSLVMNIMDLSNITNLDVNGNLMIDYIESKELGRTCHLSKKQNVELAGYIKRYFDNRFDIHNTFNNVERYYTKANTLNEAGLIRI